MKNGIKQDDSNVRDEYGNTMGICEATKFLESGVLRDA